jgi:hypothetical protein
MEFEFIYYWVGRSLLGLGLQSCFLSWVRKSWSSEYSGVVCQESTHTALYSSNPSIKCPEPTRTPFGSQNQPHHHLVVGWLVLFLFLFQLRNPRHHQLSSLPIIVRRACQAKEWTKHIKRTNQNSDLGPRIDHLSISR